MKNISFISFLILCKNAKAAYKVNIFTFYRKENISISLEIKTCIWTFVEQEHLTIIKGMFIIWCLIKRCPCYCQLKKVYFTNVRWWFFLIEIECSNILLTFWSWENLRCGSIFHRGTRRSVRSCWLHGRSCNRGWFGSWGFQRWRQRR